MKKLCIRLGIISLGCDKNRYDTEKMMNSLQDVVEFCVPEEAEWVFVNSCAFLEAARKEMEGILREFKNKKIILGGCYKKLFTPEFQQKFPQVKAFIDPKTDENFREKMCELFGARPKKEAPFNVITTTSPSHAFVKIAEGCNRNCAFCLIPFLTGKYVSREKIEILNDVAQRVQAEIKEIILVAQDTGMYGLDLKPAVSLARLLKKIEHIPGDFWVRVLYLYPETITEELLEVFQKSKRLVPYFDFPIQHTAPEVLKKMGRNPEPLKKIKEIKKALPEAVLRTTIMVGFPGETEEDFVKLKQDLEEVKFQHISVFKYSAEKGTRAAEMTGQVDEKVKEKREREILKLGLENRMEFLGSLVGHKLPALVDSIEHGKAFLRTWHFSPEIDGGIYAKAPKGLLAGDAVLVEITGICDINLEGKII